MEQPFTLTMYEGLFHSILCIIRGLFHSTLGIFLTPRAPQCMRTIPSNCLHVPYFEGRFHSILLYPSLPQCMRAIPFSFWHILYFEGYSIQFFCTLHSHNVWGLFHSTGRWHDQRNKLFQLNPADILRAFNPYQKLSSIIQVQNMACHAWNDRSDIQCYIWCIRKICREALQTESKNPILLQQNLELLKYLYIFWSKIPEEG